VIFQNYGVKITGCMKYSNVLLTLLKCMDNIRVCCGVALNYFRSSVLLPLLFLLYTADLPSSPKFTTTTFDDDTAVVAMNSDPAIASQKLQTNAAAIQN
jgi:hypothetical protein